MASENRIFKVYISSSKCLGGPCTYITLQFFNTNPHSFTKVTKTIIDPAPLRTDLFIAHGVCMPFCTDNKNSICNLDTMTL